MSQMPMDIARIKPTGDQVLIRRLPVEDEKTKGGVILPDDYKTTFFKAEVLKAGPGRKDVGVANTLDVKEGDIVLVEDDVSKLEQRPIPPHLLPVSRDNRKFYLVVSSYIFAIQIPEADVDPARVQPEESNLIGPDEPITDLEPKEDTTDVESA